MGDNTQKRSGFGISELGSTPASDPLAEIEAERLQPTRRRLRPGQEWMQCRNCGQVGYTGEYPFSTNPSSRLCDDCM
jgi:hypothetical protein